MPPGYQLKDNIAWGQRAPGLLEIKYHDPKTRNASTQAMQRQIAILINEAQKDTSIKVILFHGGRYFSSGNNLKGLTSTLMSQDPAEIAKQGGTGIFEGMTPMLQAFHSSVKPIVAVVRGGANGIAFTTLSLVDFLYVSPDVKMQTPFMSTFQSPEGSSTMYFPEIFGRRKAAEILLLD
jgi:enoyl-CoA hydratase/carnithine racemase